ncbi:unnamed protein product [Rotaria magnacalcarata]|uniref:EF-hand domain-containing protein n=1 Tax=Rotaria magnacalcarata TaxID=392030 RepID=A0A816SZ96_9BILA|nr:unnamed protein product [Rotaria magnacalcarata]CAF1630344.1 unnamed protein product [Rotaria magnacalcarata]CAF2089020.1 unnamed protein product [Rotaria magnacalcarata]CAF2145855.1 unnamed protein product [Rotaria magnacalcarata]CAF2157218.1 unnamed protein product [Rotaria magnacalcarata]
MGARPSIPDSINIDEIINNTGLSRKQISALWTRFYELDCGDRGETKGCKGYLDETDFGRVPKFDENPIAPRLIKVIFDDFGSDKKLTFPQFVTFMSTFSQCERGGHEHHHRLHHHHAKRRSSIQTLTTNNTPQMGSSTGTDVENVKYSADDTPKTRKIKFMFRMYDIDRDGRLSKEDIQETLKMMVGKISDEEASIIAEKVLGEFTNEQQNSTVSRETFEETLKTLDFMDKMGLKLLK